MQKIWSQHYVTGTPLEIDMNEFKTVVEVFEKSCAKFAPLPAFSNFGREISYQDLEILSRQFAAYLQKKLGLKKGDSIAIQMPNLHQYPIVLFGALRAGLVVVNTNPLYTPREMQHQFKDAGVKAIVILENFAHHLEKIIDQTEIKHVILTEVGDLLGFPKKLIVNAVLRYVKKAVPAHGLKKTLRFIDVINEGADLRFDPVATELDDVCVLQYTGGTTGVAKGAMLTNKNLVANMQQISSVMGPFLSERIEIPVLPLPLYHIFCFTLCMSFLKIGAKNVLITNPKDMPAFIKELSKHPFTLMIGVNTLFNGLVNQPDFLKLDFKHLKVTVGGGMAVQEKVSRKWKEVTGKFLVEGYGLTETSPLLSVNPIDGSGRLGTIGIPVSSTDMKIVKDDGTDAAPGDRGEIWATGPQIMKGYWKRPDETANVMEGVWFKTGDVGIMSEDGYFKIVDRKKEMILVSGFNVYPNEIEEEVVKCEGVLEAAAIGVPDEKSGESVKVYVVKKDPNLTEEAIIKHCRGCLTSYKVPRSVEFRDELPKSNVGKILRRVLKEELAAKTVEAAKT